MNTNYSLYGITASTLEDARVIVEQGLGLAMSLHESSWVGDYYRAGTSGGEHFVLQPNYDSFEDEWTEPSHQNAKFLLYVNETQRAAALRDTLSRLRQVRHLRTG